MAVLFMGMYLLISLSLMLAWSEIRSSGRKDETLRMVKPMKGRRQ